MRKTCFTIVFMLLMANVLFAQQFTVATYNLRLDTEQDKLNQWKYRAPHVTALIRFHGFDIFGTQEGFKHQLEAIKADLANFDYIGVGRDDGHEKGEYSAIFYDTTRFEAVKQGTFWLSENTQSPNKGWDAALPRICTWGLFRDKQTDFLFFLFNTHFDHVGIEARKQSARLIVAKAKELGEGTPMIITGDFNVDQHDESYDVLNSGGKVKDAYELAEYPYAPNGTFNAFNITKVDHRRIDHIFLSPPFKVLKYGILTDSYDGKLPSDHFPVLVKVAYP